MLGRLTKFSGTPPQLDEDNAQTHMSDMWYPMVRMMHFRKQVAATIIGRLMRPTAAAVMYSPDQLERTLYDPASGSKGMQVSRSKLLNIHEIISLSDENISPGIIRFLTDWRAKVADVIMMVSVVAMTVTTPLTYIWDGSWSQPDLVPGGRLLIIVDLIWDIVYAVYLVLLLHMSFLHPGRRVEVVEALAIRHRWLHDPLWWADWATTVVYILVIPCDLPLWINNVKFIRTRHLISNPDSLWRIQDKGWMALLRPVALLFLGGHWLACFLFCWGGYREHGLADGVEEFEAHFIGQTINGSQAMYVRAFTEAVYMLTGCLDNVLGSGTVRENNFFAMLIIAVGGPTGCIVVAVLISTVVRHQELFYALDMRHEENKAFMTRALRILNIPMALQCRVLSMHYYQRMGHDMEAFSELFNKKNLSPALENALLVYLYRDTVCSSSYFVCKDPIYIIEVLRALQFQVYLPGDYVARKGEVGTAMYFISKGTLSVLVPDIEQKNRVSQAKQVKVLSRGDNFGEVGLFMDNKRTAWVRSDSYALVSALFRSKIEPIWEHFPEEKEKLLQKVRDTVAQDRKRVVSHRWHKGVRGVLDALQVKKDRQMMSEGVSTRSEVGGHWRVDEDSDSDGSGVPGPLLVGQRSTSSRRSKASSRSFGLMGHGAEGLHSLQASMNLLLTRQSALEQMVIRVLHVTAPEAAADLKAFTAPLAPAAATAPPPPSVPPAAPATLTAAPPGHLLPAGCQQVGPEPSPATAEVPSAGPAPEQPALVHATAGPAGGHEAPRASRSSVFEVNSLTGSTVGTPSVQAGNSTGSTVATVSALQDPVRLASKGKKGRRRVHMASGEVRPPGDAGSGVAGGGGAAWPPPRPASPRAGAAAVAAPSEEVRFPQPTVRLLREESFGTWER